LAFAARGGSVSTVHRAEGQGGDSGARQVGDDVDAELLGGLEAHREIGAYAARSAVDVLVAVGPLSSVMPAAFGREAHVATDAAEAASLVARLVRPVDVVLVKASRGIGLETVAEALAHG